jgi:hypothetical protein
MPCWQFDASASDAIATVDLEKLTHGWTISVHIRPR